MKVVCGLCLFIVALAYTSAEQFPPAPADGSCEPGKSYQVDCNTCVCAPTGKLGVCTLAACLPPRSKRQSNDDLPPVPADRKCVAGQTYRDDCNTCNCGPDGKIGGCTYKLCPPRNKREAATKAFPPLPPDGTCIAGNSYQQDCNVCRCLPNGALACTEKACVSKRSADPQACNEGETKQEACNSCHCANGLWACTKKFCNRKTRETCVNGETKNEACNSCRCANGAWACTRKICPGQNRKRRDTEEQCTVGAFKMEDCNTCNCIKLGDGKTGWGCTKLACPHEPVRTRRDAGVTSDLKNTPCAPNDFFQLDCNTCYCNSAKTGYLCTENICPPDNTTEISTSNSEGVENSTLSTTLSSNNSSSTATALSLESSSPNSTEASSSELQTSSIASILLYTNSTEEQNINSTDTVG